MQFGYHPIPDDLSVVLGKGDFQRAVVVDHPVAELYEAVQAVRVVGEPAPPLPAGIYWFLGLEAAMLLQVGVGPIGAADLLELDAWDDDLEHPLIDAWSWSEHFWERGALVPPPRFEVAQRVVTVPAHDEVEIRSRSYSGESWSYRVFGEGGPRTQLERKLEPISATSSPDEWVLGARTPAARFGATLTRTKLRGRFADTVYSFGASRTVFWPYQFKPVLKLLETGRARILIADEVGLGKTIEAGLIWTELEARHEADRVLIVCPSVLVDKWRDEMTERFGFELTHLHRDELHRFLSQHREDRLPKRRAYVVSLETMRSWEALEELADHPPQFDLVIVDEAHSMRNTDTKSYELGLQLSEWTLGSSMVFLTATPINLRETDLLHLLGLLEPGDYETIEDLEARLEPNAVLNAVGRMLSRADATATDFDDALRELNGLAFERAITLRPEFAELKTILRRAPLRAKDVVAARRLIGELNALSTTVTRTRRADVDEQKALRDAEPGVEIVWNPAESAFYTEYLAWCQARARLSGTPMYFSMQMPIRLASTSVHLAARQVLSRDPEFLRGDTEADLPRSWVEPHPALVDSAKRVLATDDTKLLRLGSVLEELHGMGRQALLFTWSKATLSHLQSAFTDRYRIAVLNGDVPRDRRRAIMKDFRAGGYDFLFANRVASEGLDFEFCSAVINYDLPWNPMEVEQRIGRIDRIGQQSEKIVIRNFYNEEAIDSRIMYKVLQRIEIFERSIGELEPIIGQHMDVLKQAMDFTLTRSQQEAKAQQFLQAIEAQKAGLQEVAESAAGLIISSSVEIAGFEEELIASGRYLGQLELAHLIDDWAVIDGGDRLQWSDDGKTVELLGSAAMALRVQELVQLGRRTRGEVGTAIADLQNRVPINLAIDQELSRTSGVELLSANHTLVNAAVRVPAFRQARFASVRTRANAEVPPGRYLVVLAHAEHASRGGDEIWGAAVSFDGVPAGEAPADTVLAALARGTLQEGAEVDVFVLPRLARIAMGRLENRLQEVQDRRETEEGALSQSRRALLTEQHERRMRTIERRMQTLVERGRGDRVVHMTRGQLKRQQDRYLQLLAELEARKVPAVSLHYLAVCALEVTS
ncbi:hypothetical protein D8Y24_07380 [Agrococcus lahaulensis]|nr:hypothetical protein D8Y24_07380 [Agrococcus lahaulensis]